MQRETDEPGDIRLYQPGDPVRRIHWKLSAKKNELLVRETAAEWESVEEERAADAPAKGKKRNARKRLALVLTAGMLLCILLLAQVPEARRGAQVLCNRLFAASEQLNAYAYSYFAVPDGQSVFFGSCLVLCFLAVLAALTILLRSRLLTLGLMAACTLFQVYFGLPFPLWVNVPLYALLALDLMRRPFLRESLLTYGAAVLLVSLAVMLLIPGVDVATEAASENVRDSLSRMTQQLTGGTREAPAGETETRHAHTLSLETGMREARPEREYRLMTVEEEQISMPRWVDYLKIALLLLLSAALVTLPFAPFLVLNARRRKAQEARKAFQSENVNEAVCAVFRQVIAWLEGTNQGAGNLLYRNWADRLAESLPDGYVARFAQCAADFEEAAYSDHVLPEEKRQTALALLKETETALWRLADWKQRLLLKYWMCLCES